MANRRPVHYDGREIRLEDEGQIHTAWIAPGGLEGVLQRELNVALGGVGRGDGAEVGIGHSVVRRSVADDVERIEEVAAEFQTLFRSIPIAIL